MRHPLLWQFLLILLIVAFIVKFVWWLVAAVAVIVLGWWLCEGLAAQPPASQSAITKQPPRIIPVAVLLCLAGQLVCRYYTGL
jgi:hypothetical protein